MKYRIEKDFGFLNGGEFDVFFIDIEGTVFAANMNWEMLLDKSFYRLFLMSIETNNILEHKMSDIMYVGKNFVRELTDINIPKIFAREQSKGRKLIALSSGFKSSQKLLKFKQLGISFDELLFTQRKDKGDFLLTYLQRHSELANKRICVIDNHAHKLDSIRNAINANNIELVLYKNDYIHELTENSFIRYWYNVVQSMEKFNHHKRYKRQK